VWPITGTVTVVKNNKPWPNLGGGLSTGNYIWGYDTANIAPHVTNQNPAGYRVTRAATGTVSTWKADFDLQLSNSDGCTFLYHYKWNP
jgi:hypothetical protein